MNTRKLPQDNCGSVQLSNCVNQVLWILWSSRVAKQRTLKKISWSLKLLSSWAQLKLASTPAHSNFKNADRKKKKFDIMYYLENRKILAGKGVLKLAAAWHWGKREKKDSWLEMTHFELFSHRHFYCNSVEKCEELRIIKVLEVHLSPWKLQLPKLITDNAFIWDTGNNFAQGISTGRHRKHYTIH